MNMKAFLILFSVFALLGNVKAQYDFEAVERERMARARVRTQTQMTHDYADGRPAVRGWRSAVTTFDTRGNITEIVNYNREGKIILRVVSRYDNRNNLISLQRFNEKNEERYSQRNTFDAAGNKVRESGFNGVAQYNNTFTYDTNGRLTEIRYMEGSALVERREFRYTGNRIEILIFGANNSQQYRQENTYNDRGLLVSEVRTGGAANNVVHALTMQYNGLGDMTEEVRRRANNVMEYQKIFHYDSSNRPIKTETVNPDGTRFVSQEHQFNAQGNLIQKSWRKNNRTEASTEKYTYDARGLYTDVDSFFASFNLNTLYKYIYELH